MEEQARSIQVLQQVLHDASAEADMEAELLLESRLRSHSKLAARSGVLQQVRARLEELRERQQQSNLSTAESQLRDAIEKQDLAALKAAIAEHAEVRSESLDCFRGPC